MNTINRGLWVNETNDAYEMRVLIVVLMHARMYFKDRAK